MDNTTEKEYTLFKTIKPTHVMIVRQPFIVQKRGQTGPKKGKVISREPAQYNEMMDSIYIKDQKKLYDDPKPTNLYMKRGNMLVDNDNISLLSLMRNHSDNTDNGGTLFREVDVEKDELYEIKLFEKLDESVSIIMKSDEPDLRTLAVELIGVKELRTSFPALKKKLRALVSQTTEPKYVEGLRDKVIAFSNEKNKQERIISIVALQGNIIVIKDGNKIAWGDESNELIFTGSQKRDVVKEFSTWLKTDEQGREVYTSITTKIENGLDG